MPASLTDVDEFTAPLAVPVDQVDPRSVATLMEFFQGVANRTRNAKNRLDALATALQYRAGGMIVSSTFGLGPTAEPYYSDSDGVAAARTRTRRFSAIGAIGFDSHGISGTGASGNADRKVLRWVLNDLVPHGTTVTRVRALLAPGDTRAARSGGAATSGDGGRMFMRYRTFFPNYTVAGFGTASVTGLAEDDGTTAAQVIDSGAVVWAVENNGTAPAVHVLELVCGANAGAENDAISGIEVTFSDLYPGRNY